MYSITRKVSIRTVTLVRRAQQDTLRHAQYVETVMKYQLAQLNIAKFKLPQEDPVNADFVANLDRVNELAEQQPGFVWRFTGEGNNAMDVDAFDDRNIAVNMSLWEDLESLAAFVYRNEAHLQIMRRRKEWFEKLDFYLVLWWVEAGQLPGIEDAKARLQLLTDNGPSVDAFTFRQPYPAPGAGPVDPILDECA